MLGDTAPQIAPMLAKFALGYLAVLAAPGPNMLAVGSLAALRGFRGVLPFCLGIAAGAATLAAALHLAFGMVPDTAGLELAARAIGGTLLLVVALRVLRTRRPVAEAGPPPRLEDDAVVFGMGFGTAASNPISAAYYLAQILGPLGEVPAVAVVPVVALEVLAFALLVALVFARPTARRLALAYHRTVCVVSGTVLAGLALVMLAPLWTM